MTPLFQKYTVKTQMNFNKYIGSLGLFIIAMGGIFAQSGDDTIKTLQLQEVVVTAQYAPLSKEASVFKMKVIDKVEIQAKGATNLRELLLHELNVDLKQRSVFGTSIDIQGISKENVRILVDGTPVIGRLNGVIDLNQMSLDEVERIEIIEGPTSVYYGTDALAGVVNIITKKQQSHKFIGSVTSYYESVGQYNLSAKTGIRGNKDMLQLSGGRNYFDGYSAVDTSRHKQWESREQYFGKLYYSHYFNNIRVSNTANFFTEEQLVELENPEGGDRAKDIYYTTRRWNDDIGIAGYVSSNKYIDLVFSYSDYTRWHNSYDVNLNDGSQEISTKTSDHDTTSFNLWFIKGQFSKDDSSKFNYSLGYEINIGSTEGKRILDGKQSMENYAFFGSIKYAPFQKLIIQPGIRYTYNTSYNAPVSPAINIKYAVGSNANLRASYAMGYRAPSLKELYLEFHVPAGPFTYHIYGNPDLKAEQSNNFSLSYSQRLSFGKVQSLTIEPSLFYNDITNLIALSDLVNFERYYINVNKHETYGGKLELNYHPVKNLGLGFGISHIARYNAFTEDHDVKKFTSTNDLNGKVQYFFPKWKTSLAMFYKYNGERPGFSVDRSTGDIQETYIGDYQILDLTLTRSFWDELIQMTIGGKNLLNVQNIETVGRQREEIHSTDLALWGSTFFVQMKINFSKGS